MAISDVAIYFVVGLGVCTLGYGIIAILTIGEQIMLNLSDIQREVAEIGEVTNSAVTLIEQIAQLVRDLPANQDAINALAADLDAKASALAAAVAANTPGETPPEA